MKLKKRRKSSRARGLRLGGWAAKKHKGTGNVGGKGMSGSGKRGKQKKTLIIKYFPDYFGKGQRLKSKPYKLKVINVGDIEKQIEKFKKKGMTKDGVEIRLLEYKVLGDGAISKKLIITAAKFTGSAKEKIEKAGGKALIKEKEIKKPKEKKKVKIIKKEIKKKPIKKKKK
jgi:large subunit ribosomal protein L15